MNNRYPGLAHDTALSVDTLSRVIYEMREAHKAILRQHAAEDEAALLDAIVAGRVDEHPGYDNWLSARILATGAEAARTHITALINGHAPDAAPTLHLRLLAMLEAGDLPLAGAPTLLQDALQIPLANGIVLNVRQAACHAYAMEWTHAGATLRIDTAPLHAALATRPNHLHAADGTLCPDFITDTAAAPEANLRALIEAIMRDPALDGGD